MILVPNLVRLTNFRSFVGTVELPLKNLGLVGVVGVNRDVPGAGANAALRDAIRASNGSGKSSLLEAIDWCLFGLTRGSAARVTPRVPPKTGEKGTRVDAFFNDGAVVVSRTRGVSGVPDGPKLWVNGEDKTALDVDETQRRIDATFGMDAEVWQAAVSMPQRRRWSFASATDAQRKDMMVRVVPELEQVDALGLAAKAKLAVVSSELTAAEGRLKAIAAEKESLLKQRGAFEKEAQQFEASRMAEAQRLQSIIAMAPQARAQIEAQVQTIPAPMPLPTPPVLLPILRDAAAANLGAVMGALRNAMDEEARSHAKVCPTCGTTLAAGAAHEMAAKVASTVASLRVEAAAAQKAYDDADAAFRKEDSDARAAFAQANAQVAAHNATVAALQAQARAAWQRVAEGEAEAQARLAALSSVNRFVALIAEINVKGAALEREEAALNAGLAPLRERHRALDFWVDACGNAGLKSALIDGHLKVLTAEANRWLEVLTGGTVACVVSPVKTTGKGKGTKIVDKIDVQVFFDVGGKVTTERLEEFSGGEAYRVSAAIDFAFSRVVASRAQHRIDLLLLDEVFVHLDAFGKDAFSRVLAELSKERGTVLVVEHDRDILAALPQWVLVEKKGGVSHLDLGSIGGKA